MSSIKEKIAGILTDHSKTQEERVETLLAMREDARALQRAETEGGMTGTGQSEADLREIDRALQKLGREDDLDADENSAATL